MEIIDEPAHRLLAYIEAVNRQGHVLTKLEFEAFAGGWEPKVTVTVGSTELSMTLANIQRMTTTALFGARTQKIKSMLDFFCRVRWVMNKDDKVFLTSLGTAVLREANSPRPDSDASSTLEVVIDPANPFAYAQLMSKVTNLGDCLIVDPYLDAQQLLTLAAFPNVTRILMGDRGLQAKAPSFGLILQSAPHLDVRTVKQGDLHDRFVIPAQGSVYMLGSSLNSIAKRFGIATTLEESSSRLIAANYDAIWAEGKSMPNPATPPAL